MTLRLAELIRLAMRHNGVVVAHIYGNFGFGKTSYALWTAYHVLGSWDRVLDYLFFSPKDALDAIGAAITTGKRLPLIIMDDAGLWLDRMTWWEQDKVAFMKFFNLIRSVAAGVIFTTPTEDLPKAILKKSFFRVETRPTSIEEITAQYGDEVACRVQETARKHGLKPVFAVAKIYRLRTLPSFMCVVKKESSDIYPLHYPVFEEYEKLRREALKEYYDEWRASILESANKEKSREELYSLAERMLRAGASKRDVARQLRQLGVSKSTAYYIIKRVLKEASA